MGMAALANAPVLLVGDIDRGGVFASLYGTVALLEEEERRRIKGFVINKFRGDVELLKPGLTMLEERTGIPVLGVIPYIRLDLDDEDSLSERLAATSSAKGEIDIAVIRLPRISNFTDFNTLSRMERVGLRYVEKRSELKTPDCVLLPGTKNTMSDLLWLRQSGLEAAIKKLAAAGTPVIGICGGYQMLGQVLHDPLGIEQGGSLRGMELLPVSTVFEAQKTRMQTAGKVSPQNGEFVLLTDAPFSGYEIHMGKTERHEGVPPFVLLADGTEDGAVSGNVCGCYIHGVLDGAVGEALVRLLLEWKGLIGEYSAAPDTEQHKQAQYDKLAETLREHLDFKQIYRILEEGA